MHNPQKVCARGNHPSVRLSFAPCRHVRAWLAAPRKNRGCGTKLPQPRRNHIHFQPPEKLLSCKAADRQDRRVIRGSVVCDAPLRTLGLHDPAVAVIDRDMVRIDNDVSRFCLGQTADFGPCVREFRGRHIAAVIDTCLLQNQTDKVRAVAALCQRVSSVHIGIADILVRS